MTAKRLRLLAWSFAFAKLHIFDTKEKVVAANVAPM